MIYLTIIAVVLGLIVITAVVMVVLHQIVETIAATVQDMNDRNREAKLDEYDSIGSLFSNMVYGPGNVPTKSAAEIFAEISEKVDQALMEEDGIAFPPHEEMDQFLKWLPDEPPPFPDDLLIPLPEHEDNDEFMNEVPNDA